MSLLVAYSALRQMLEWLVDRALARCFLIGTVEDTGYNSIHW